MLKVPVTTANVADWVRKAANAINELGTKAVQKDGADIYAAPTASVTYDDAQIQALMDAVEVISNRLK